MWSDSGAPVRSRGVVTKRNRKQKMERRKNASTNSDETKLEDAIERTNLPSPMRKIFQFWWKGQFCLTGKLTTSHDRSLLTYEEVLPSITCERRYPNTRVKPKQEKKFKLTMAAIGGKPSKKNKGCNYDSQCRWISGIHDVGKICVTAGLVKWAGCINRKQ